MSVPKFANYQSVPMSKRFSWVGNFPSPVACAKPFFLSKAGAASAHIHKQRGGRRKVILINERRQRLIHPPGARDAAAFSRRQVQK